MGDTVGLGRALQMGRKLGCGGGWRRNPATHCFVQLRQFGQHVRHLTVLYGGTHQPHTQEGRSCPCDFSAGARRPVPVGSHGVIAWERVVYRRGSSNVVVCVLWSMKYDLPFAVFRMTHPAGRGAVSCIEAAGADREDGPANDTTPRCWSVCPWLPRPRCWSVCDRTMHFDSMTDYTWAPLTEPW